MAERRAAAAADAARGDDRGGAVAARRSGSRDRGAAAREVVDDELQRRIRSLEAERLRPVPPPPVTVRSLDLIALVDAIAPPNSWQKHDPKVKTDAHEDRKGA